MTKYQPTCTKYRIKNTLLSVPFMLCYVCRFIHMLKLQKYLIFTQMYMQPFFHYTHHHVIRKFKSENGNVIKRIQINMWDTSHIIYTILVYFTRIIIFVTHISYCTSYQKYFSPFRNYNIGATIRGIVSLYSTVCSTELNLYLFLTIQS